MTQRSLSADAGGRGNIPRVDEDPKHPWDLLQSEQLAKRAVSFQR